MMVELNADDDDWGIGWVMKRKKTTQKKFLSITDR